MLGCIGPISCDGCCNCGCCFTSAPPPLVFWEAPGFWEISFSCLKNIYIYLLYSSNKTITINLYTISLLQKKKSIFQKYKWTQQSHKHLALQPICLYLKSSSYYFNSLINPFSFSTTIYFKKKETYQKQITKL